MTYVINQGLALYWGTSRWGAAEIMVSVLSHLPLSHNWLPFSHGHSKPYSIGEGGVEENGRGALAPVSAPAPHLFLTTCRRPMPWPDSSI